RLPRRDDPPRPERHHHGGLRRALGEAPRPHRRRHRRRRRPSPQLGVLAMTEHDRSRREFLKLAAAAGFGSFVLSATSAWGLDEITNPLASYPDRDWEKVYRDLWKYDSKFTFTCAPNDTHNCILNGYVRSGVVTRIGPTMRYGEA